MSQTNKKNKMFEARLISREALAPDVYALTFQSNTTYEIDYKAGQYAYLDVSGHEKRPYSIASSPHKTDISFHIKDTGHGLSHALSALEVGQPINISCPHGHAEYQSDADTSLLLIGGGLGLAPLMPIAKAALDENPDRKVHIYHCVETAKDLYLHNALKEMADATPNLKYTPVTEDDGDYYITGRAPKAVADDLSKELNHMDAYISGPPKMVIGTVEALTPLGLNIDRVFSDTNLGDLR